MTMAYSFSSITTPSTLPSFSFFGKTSQISITGKRNHRFKVSCDQNPVNNNNSEHGESWSGKFDRRNMLIGLGGLYGVASGSTLGTDHLALANPLLTLAPDLHTSHDVEFPKMDCSLSRHIVDFSMPPTPEIKRVRSPAHLASKEYIEKYSNAIKLMKELPADDPRSFNNQAKVHCAYCNGAYEQVGFPNLEFQVHSSWLFFPFHRLYLYFFEKIMGNLIDDPTFALPFWNWDSPDGMKIPQMYVDSNSSLYDKYRDGIHLPPKMVDFDYRLVENNKSDSQLVSDNLHTMYRQMVSNATTAPLFLGNPYLAGSEPEPGAGTIENSPHGIVHVWVGDRSRDNLEDMGLFTTAARDPIFYAHHANVDRMWTIWVKNHNNFVNSDDWLDTSFIFCDENAQLVRVKVRDSLDNIRLGYEYAPVDIPWMYKRPTPRLARNLRINNKSSSAISVEKYADENFPRALNKVIKVMVSRPRKSRTIQEKEKEEEVLVIQGIELGSDEFVKFDVFINEDDEAKSGPSHTEFAGSFVHVPHGHKHGKKKKTQFRIGISELLKDLEAEDNDKVLVTLVPKEMRGTVNINGIKIEHETIN